MKFRRSWLVLFLVGVLLLGGCVSKGTYNKKVEELESRVSTLEDQLATVTSDKEQLANQLDEVLLRGWMGDQVLVYYTYETDTDFYLVPVVKKVEFSKDTDPRRTALEELLAGPGPGSMLQRPLPEGVRVLSLDVDDSGLATVDLSREVQDLNAGARTEDLAVAAIVNTLTEFPEIDSVQLLVEGQTQESLAGHVDISKPLEQDNSVILR